MTADRLCDRKQVTSTKLEAEKDNVKVPTTIEEYCLKSKHKAPDLEADLLTDFYDDDDYNAGDEDDEDEGQTLEDDNEDSGNGES